MIIRREYHFTGIVQGVGFRWRARHAAAGMGITGWVHNEWDGSVTMQAQGSEFQLDRLLEAVNGGDYIVIDSVEAKELPLEEDEYGFHVR
ncbi:MAG: acylphosphatase [Lachnospiraceae bacterium]|nr:acylphosphatase [Lachnospiraceae bacterium]